MNLVSFCVDKTDKFLLKGLIKLADSRTVIAVFVCLLGMCKPGIQSPKQTATHEDLLYWPTE